MALAAVLLMGAAAADAASGPALTGITASASDASTAASNPAGLARIGRAEWMGSVMSFYSQSEFETSIDSIGAATTDDSSGSLFIPSVYYVRPVDDEVSVGISLTVPAGLGSDPGDETPGRYLLDEWSLGYVSLAPAASYRVNEQLSLGAALNLNFASYNYETAVYNGPGEPDGRMELTDGDFAVGFQLGLLYEPSPRTRFGLSYRSSSESEFEDRPELSGLTPEREEDLEDGLRSRTISLESKFPQMVSAGAYHEFAGGSAVTFDVVWVDFSQFGLTQAQVDGTTVATESTQYDDIWAASAGYDWPVNADWTLSVGVAYASSGVEDENRSFALRLDRVIGAGVGAEYRWGGDRVIGANLTYFDLGDAPVRNDVPLLGEFAGEYDENYAIGLDLSFRWMPR